MAVLYLIGLGFSEKDITLRGIEIAKSCEKCFVELYTSLWEGKIENLETLIGKKIALLERSDLEENCEKWLTSIKNYETTLFVAGDPLVATTHSSLLVEASKLGIKCKIIHAPSIYSAISSCGLQIYRFGKTATIPNSEQMEHVKRVVEENKKINAHTLLLTDINMRPKEAIEKLLKHGIINENEKIVVASRLGMEGEKIVYTSPLENTINKLSPPCAIVIPAKLHFAEEEFLKYLGEIYEC